MVEIVVKVGGGLLAHPDVLDAVLAEISASACRGARLLVVPGGGPFADAVRDLDRRVGLSDDEAHWMAVLAMDQYAHLVASRLSGATLVSSCGHAEAAHAAGRVPVLAPYRWLREADPLPHSWEVTSDSIAAWVAGQVCAPHLVLVKPPGVHAGDPRTGDVVDARFSVVLPASVTAAVVAADRIDTLRSSLALRA